jgi:hypothetical protein
MREIRRNGIECVIPGPAGCRSVVSLS